MEAPINEVTAQKYKLRKIAKEWLGGMLYDEVIDTLQKEYPSLLFEKIMPGDVWIKNIVDARVRIQVSRGGHIKDVIFG
jgi:hypothetical protein